MTIEIYNWVNLSIQFIISLGTLIALVVFLYERKKYIITEKKKEDREFYNAVLTLVRLFGYQKNFIEKELNEIWIRYSFVHNLKDFITNCSYDKSKVNLSDETQKKIEKFISIVKESRTKQLLPNSYTIYENKNHVIELYIYTNLKPYKELTEMIEEYIRLESKYKKNIENNIEKYINSPIEELIPLIDRCITYKEGRLCPNISAFFTEIDEKINRVFQKNKENLVSKCTEIQENLKNYLK